jgi:hypothetical protein
MADEPSAGPTIEGFATHYPNWDLPTIFADGVVNIHDVKELRKSGHAMATDIAVIKTQAANTNTKLDTVYMLTMAPSKRNGGQPWASTKSD